MYYLAPEGGQPHQGRLARAPMVVRMRPKPAGPAPKPKGPPLPADLGPKAAPTAGYVRADPAAAPRAKPRAEPSAAFRQTEAELIRLLGAAPLEDPIEDF